MAAPGARRAEERTFHQACAAGAAETAAERGASPGVPLQTFGGACEINRAAARARESGVGALLWRGDRQASQRSNVAPVAQEWTALLSTAEVNATPTAFTCRCRRSQRRRSAQTSCVARAVAVGRRLRASTRQHKQATMCTLFARHNQRGTDAEGGTLTSLPRAAQQVSSTPSTLRPGCQSSARTTHQLCVPSAPVTRRRNRRAAKERRCRPVAAEHSVERRSRVHGRRSMRTPSRATIAAR